MTRSSHNDHELLHRISQGDQQAFTTFYNNHWDKLYNYLLKVAKIPKAAEELCQDVFLKIWQGRQLAEQIQNIDAFLQVVGRRKAIDFLRKTASHPMLQQLIADYMSIASEQRADSQLLTHEARALLEEALQQLSPQRRMVFMLHRVDGLSHEEIADLLGLSKQTVKNTMSEAQKSIHRYLRQKPGSELLVLLLFLHPN